MSATTSNIVQVESFLQHMVAAATPIVENSVNDGINIAAEVVRISCIQYEISGAIMVIIALIMLSQAKKYAMWIKNGFHSWSEGQQTLTVIGGVVGFVAMFLFAIGGINHITNVWEWTGIVEPKLQLAHLAIQKVLSSTK